MTMVLGDGRYISRIFYTELKVTRPGNMMGYLYRLPDEPTIWHYQYRMRYYVDDDLTEKSKDIKNWYHGSSTPGAPIEPMVRTIRMLFELGGGGTFDELIIESADPKAQHERFNGAPWLHRTVFTKEEWDARQRAKN